MQIVVDTRPPVAFGLAWRDCGPKTTAKGPRRLFEAAPTDAFSAAWRAQRDRLRDTGYGFARDGDGWLVNFWARPSAEAVQAAATAHAAAVEASRATDADLDIPVPEGRAYLPYQRGGIAYGVQRDGVLLGDEPGLGKTIQAIGIANASGARTILVICPASLKLNWARELSRWLVATLPVHVIEGGKAAWPDVAAGGVVIVNYDVLYRYEAAVRSRTWDVVIADEAHFLKGKESRRTRAVFGGPKTKTASALEPISAKRRLLLTGTPMNSRPSELFTLLHYLDPQGWPSFFDFARRYCDAHKDVRGHWDFDGSSNEAELQERLRAGLMVRRLKADVLHDLPAKVRQVLPLAADTGALRKLLRDEQAAHDVWERLSSARDASAEAAFEALSKLREQVGLAKAPLIAEHILQDAGPVVAFAHHRSVVDRVAEVLAEAGRVVVRVTGDMTAVERQEAVDRFQDDRASVILGTLGAMGVGLTLTRSAHVIIGELDWVPASISQAEDRCHRIGQRDSVHVEHLVFEGSLDSRLVEVLIEKQAVLDAVLDDRPAPVPMPAIQGTTIAPPVVEVAPGLDEAAIREIEAAAQAAVAERTERKAEAARRDEATRLAREAAEDAARERLRVALAAAGWGLSAADHATATRLVDGTWYTGDLTAAGVLVERLQGFLDRAAKRVGSADVLPADVALVADPEVREIVLAGCRYLSGLDADRARHQNGVGWSKTTSWDGHWLAGQDALDEQSAAVGLALLRHHQRQLDADMQARMFGDVREAARADRDAADFRVRGALRDLARDEALSAADQSAAFLLRCRDIWTSEERASAEAIVDRASTPVPAPVDVPAPLDSPTPNAVPHVEVPEVVAAPEVEPEAARVVEEPEPVEEVEPAPPVTRAPKGETAENVTARARLVAVGEAMYGPRWQTDLARDLGVNDRTVRRYDSGATPIPATLWADIAAVARRRRDALDAVISGLGAP